MFWEKESFHILKQSMGLFLGEKERCSFFSQGLWGGYLGKSRMVFCVHTYTLSTRKQYLNRYEEMIMSIFIGDVALKMAETLLQGQEVTKPFWTSWSSPSWPDPVSLRKRLRCLEERPGECRHQVPVGQSPCLTPRCNLRDQSCSSIHLALCLCTRSSPQQVLGQSDPPSRDLTPRATKRMDTLPKGTLFLPGLLTTM